MWSLQAADKDVDGEWEWGESTVLGRKMSALESSLRCSICSDFFINPHSLACGHVFCSECIRKHLDPKMNPTTAGICPSCRDTASLAQLRPCRDVVSTVQHFKDVRSPLLILVQSQEPTSSSHGVTASASTQCASSRSSDVSRNEGRPNTMKKLSHMDFHKMSKEKVKKALEKLTENSRKKLRLDGDKDTLERRYRDFVHLHNAQLGNSEPLTLDQIVTEITRRESAKNGLVKKGSKSLQIAKDLKNGKSPAEASQGFSSLIQQIREQKRKEKEQSKEAQSIEESGVSARPETPKKEKSIAEHGEWQVVHSEKFNVPFFFNSTNNTGQFKVPDELESIYGKLSHGDADGLGISPPTPGNVVYSPTQKKSQISTPRDKDGVVFGTYQNTSGVNTSVHKYECEEEESASFGDFQSQLPCTLVDTSLSQSQSTPHKDFSHTPSTSKSQSALSKRSLLIVDSPSNSDIEESGGSAVKSVYAHDSSYDIAQAISQKCTAESSNKAMQFMSSTPVSSHQDRINSIDNNEESEDQNSPNECPFCTFINPPLVLVCEICLGELSQVPQPVRRSQRIESFSQCSNLGSRNTTGKGEDLGHSSKRTKNKR